MSERENRRRDLIFGIHPVEKWLDSRLDEIEELWAAEDARGKVQKLAQLAGKRGVIVKYKPRTWLNKICGEGHQGICLKISSYRYAELDRVLERMKEGPVIWLLKVQDPGNIGNIVRSVRAFRAGGVILNPRGGCAITPAVIKASAGALSEVPVAREGNHQKVIRRIREMGGWLIGLDARGKTDIHKFKLDLPAVFALGGEGKGLPPRVAKFCDEILRIPIASDWDSLNVATAGAVTLYEWHRQKLMVNGK